MKNMYIEWFCLKEVEENHSCFYSPSLLCYSHNVDFMTSLSLQAANHIVTTKAPVSHTSCGYEVSGLILLHDLKATM